MRPGKQAFAYDNSEEEDEEKDEALGNELLGRKRVEKLSSYWINIKKLLCCRSKVCRKVFCCRTGKNQVTSHVSVGALDERIIDENNTASTKTKQKE